LTFGSFFRIIDSMKSKKANKNNSKKFAQRLDIATQR